MFKGGESDSITKRSYDGEWVELFGRCQSLAFKNWGNEEREISIGREVYWTRVIA